MKTKQFIYIIIGIHLLSSVVYAGNMSTRTQQAVEKIRTLNVMEGSAVYDNSRPGLFYLEFLKLSREGSKEEFEQMIQDSNVFVRAMGLLCLVRSGEKITPAIWNKFFASENTYVCFPGGCMGETITEGQFARNLIHNKFYLDQLGISQRILEVQGMDYDSQEVRNNWWYPRQQSLMPLVDLIRLDLEILAADNTFTMHDAAAKFIWKQIRNGDLSLELENLEKTAPHLEKYQLIKALGRISRKIPIKFFLLDCLTDERLSAPQEKLAVISALSRYADPIVLSTVQQVLESGKSLPSESLSKEISQAYMDQINYKNALDKVDFFHVTGSLQEFIRLYSIPHPLLMEQIDPLFYYAALKDNKDIWRAIESTLVQMSINSRKYKAPWHTFSDLSYRLKFAVEYHNELSSYLSSTTKKRILEEIQHGEPIVGISKN